MSTANKGEGVRRLFKNLSLHLLVTLLFLFKAAIYALIHNTKDTVKVGSTWWKYINLITSVFFAKMQVDFYLFKRSYVFNIAKSIIYETVI